MNSFNVVEILGYGVIGLGFLLAFFSYRLLLKEQKTENPRPVVIRAIYSFMVFSVVLCGIGIASEFIQKQKSTRDIIGDVSHYLQTFDDYEKSVAELVEDARELYNEPNAKDQKLVNVTMNNIVENVIKERRNSESFQQVLNGALDGVKDALLQGDEESINASIIALNDALPKKRHRLEEDLKRIQEFVSDRQVKENGSIKRVIPFANAKAPPTTPTNLITTPMSSSQINLSWNASTDDVEVTGYRIYRNDTQITTTSNTNYQDTGLSPSTTYTYAVSAYDAARNESAQSSSVSATTLSLPVNNPPVLAPISDISVNEGNTVTLNPTATDPDGDALTYTYSGWMTSASYTTGYNDAGTHIVTVTVSDDILTDFQNVTVIVNDVDTTPPSPLQGLSIIK